MEKTVLNRCWPRKSTATASPGTVSWRSSLSGSDSTVPSAVQYMFVPLSVVKQSESISSRPCAVLYAAFSA